MENLASLAQALFAIIEAADAGLVPFERAFEVAAQLTDQIEKEMNYGV
jgi:hypothetical protein